MPGWELTSNGTVLKCSYSRFECIGMDIRGPARIVRASG